MLALLALAFASVAFAAEKGEFGASCVQSHNKLAFGTHQLTTECNAAFYCADNSTCAHKGCRRDDFPFGYDVDDQLPPKCGNGQFCPDEADQCLPLIAVGQPCQLNRDDQCTPPDDKSLRGPRNTDGAICLNFQCMYSNATLSSKCIIENTPYVVYDQSGGSQEYPIVVSRDNCKPGLYCDGSQLQCIQLKNIGTDCTADKECDSYNCGLNGKCAMATSTTTHVAGWVYAIIVVAIVGGMVGTLYLLFTFHRKNRAQELEKRSQYWREQESFRNNILAMREQARMSMLSLPRGLGHSDSSSPYAASKPSGLRGNPYSDEDGMEEPLVPHNNQAGYDDDYGRDASRRRTRTEHGGNRF